MCREFKNVLLAYADCMIGQLPGASQSSLVGETFTLTPEQLEVACVVVNTAEYCNMTVPQVCGAHCMPATCPG